MADEKVAEAVDIVARHVVYAVLAANLGEQWENYPGIGEYDWDAVDHRVEQIIANLRPNTEGFLAAYEFLERRAEHGAT